MADEWGDEWDDAPLECAAAVPTAASRWTLVQPAAEARRPLAPTNARAAAGPKRPDAERTSTASIFGDVFDGDDSAASGVREGRGAFSVCNIYRLKPTVREMSVISLLLSRKRENRDAGPVRPIRFFEEMVRVLCGLHSRFVSFGGEAGGEVCGVCGEGHSEPGNEMAPRGAGRLLSGGLELFSKAL